MTKQEFLDVLNTIGVRASLEDCWTFGMASIIHQMRDEALNGPLKICSGEAHWKIKEGGEEKVVFVEDEETKEDYEELREVLVR